MNRTRCVPVVPSEGSHGTPYLLGTVGAVGPGSEGGAFCRGAA